MKAVLVTLLALFSISAFAEHDATYCGKILDGKEGLEHVVYTHPEAIIAVEYRIEDGKLESWDQGYGSLIALTEKQTEFVQKAVVSSKRNGTLFCVKARWGGAAYDSLDINSISLSTDSVIRIDYMSAFTDQAY